MSEQTTVELEREAEVARARVADTAETIRNRMTPGQLIDDFTGLFSGGDGSAALNNLKLQVRDNPLPLTLIGTGLAWLILGQGSPSPSSSGGSVGEGSQGSDYNSRGEMSEAGKTTFSSSVEKVGDIVSDFADSAKSIAADTAGRVRNNVAHGSQWAGDVAGASSSSAQRMSSKARKSATELFESEPLVLAALGLAVGTAIGAMLPRTEFEDQNMGSYSDKVRGTAQDLMEKGVDGAKEVAAETYETVKEQADRVADASGETSLVDKVASVVRSTTAQAEDTIRGKLKPDIT